MIHRNAGGISRHVRYFRHSRTGDGRSIQLSHRRGGADRQHGADTAGGAPVKADIGLYGSFAETGRGHGTDRALVAGLLGMRPDDLRIPQSFELAKEEGLDFYIHPIQLREAHPNTVVLELRRADGNELMLQAASVGGGRIRVDKLNGVEVQFTGDLNTLVVQHQDVAGKVADETRELSNAGINIATMSLWRDRRGGDALIVIETDQKVSEAVRQKILDLPGVKRLTYYEKEED